MNLEKVKRDRSPERRNVRINVRLTNSQNKFIEENNLSFTKIFDEALKQLGYKEPSIEDLKKEDYHLKDSYRENKDRRYRVSKPSRTSKRPSRKRY
jgi:hypothetical protein